MFLHEPGEEKDSFTRQDLSSINAASTQRPAQQTMPISSTGRHGPPEAAPARPSSGPPALRAAQTMTRDSSRDEASPIDPGDGSALPSSASWATRGIPHGSRRGSQAPSASTPSPRVEHATLGIRPATAHKMEALVQEDVTESPPSHRRDPQPSMASDPRSTRCLPRSAAIDDHPSMAIFDQVIRAATSPNLRFSFKKGPLLDELRQYPCLIDPNGGAKLASIQARESLRQREASSRKLAQTVGRAEAEMALESGSLQLGGEPEGAPGPAENGAGMDPPGLAHQGQRHQATIQQPTHHPLPTVATVDAGLGTTSYPAANPFSNLTFNSRTFAPSQSSQHHLLLKPANPPSANYLDQYLNHPSSAQLSHGESLRQAQQLAGPSQARQSSRYPTTSDAASSGPTAKSAINTRFMGPQPGIMQTGSVANQAQTLHALQQSQQLQHVRHQAFGGSIPLPPPGLKPASIAPSSTGGLSGHGLNMGGFSPNPTGNVGHPDDRTELLREMLRTRGTSAGIGGLGIGGVVGSGGHTAEAGKRESMSSFSPFGFPSIPIHSPYSGPPSAGFFASSKTTCLLYSYATAAKGQRGRSTDMLTLLPRGGGLVDLSDPSIVHARMQQQPGSAGIGQSPYGEQGQGGFNPAGTMYGGGINRW